MNWLDREDDRLIPDQAPIGFDFVGYYKKIVNYDCKYMTVSAYPSTIGTVGALVVCRSVGRITFTGLSLGLSPFSFHLGSSFAPLKVECKHNPQT